MTKRISVAAITGACLIAGFVLAKHGGFSHRSKTVRIGQTLFVAADGSHILGFFEGLPRNPQSHLNSASPDEAPSCGGGGLLARALRRIETTVYGAGRPACVAVPCAGSYATCHEVGCTGPACTGSFSMCGSGGGQDYSTGFQTTSSHGCGDGTGYQCGLTNDCDMDECDNGFPGPVCNTTPTFECPEGVQMLCVANGVWACGDGSPGCPIPPPNWTHQSCPAGAYCTSAGWQCSPTSPIIVDTKGEGFHLTDVLHGVKFAFTPGLAAVQMSWTDPAFGNGFLVLDRNGDGIINDGSELFGNLAPQPPSATPNGFLALAVFDEPANGGNGNGLIDPGDGVYPKLRVWIDANHNGVSEPGELHALKELGVGRIDLKYRQSGYVDEFGNQFRYRAKIWDAAGRDHDTCYDVFLQTAGPDGAPSAQNSGPLQFVMK